MCCRKYELTDDKLPYKYKLTKIYAILLILVETLTAIYLFI